MEGYLTTKQAVKTLNPTITARRLLAMKARVPGVKQDAPGKDIYWPEDFKDPRNGVKIRHKNK